MKETVYLIDDTTQEIEVFSLGFRKAMQIAKNHIPIDGLTNHADGSSTYNGSFDVFGLQLSSLETIKGLDLDKLKPEEGTRLYKKYFEKSIQMALGQGGDPK